MRTETFDWMLHAPMVFKILNESRYLKNHGVKFELKGHVIHSTGGWCYSPSKIDSFDDALTVLRDNGDTGSRFDAVCLLKGVSYHRILDKGRELLSSLMPCKVSATICRCS